jgi:transcriptional regulator with XRE-family HTH domain
MRDIGKNIRDLRVEKGFTQEKLAEMLFVTRQTVSNYENGRTRPDVEAIRKIAAVLDSDVETVFYGLEGMQNRKAACRRMVISLAILLALIAVDLLLHAAFEPLASEHYIVVPGLLLNLFYDPLVYLFSGWWVMEGVSFFAKLKPLKGSGAKGAETAIWILLCACMALLLLYVLISCTAGSVPQIPVYHEITAVLITINLKYTALYALPGGLLRICGFPKRVENDKSD